MGVDTATNQTQQSVAVASKAGVSFISRELEDNVGSKTKTRRRTTYDPVIKLDAVQSFLSGSMSRHEVIEHYGIASVSTFKKWVMTYRRKGAAGLTGRTRGGAAGTRKHTPPAFDPLDPEEGYRIRRENLRLVSKLGSK